MRLPPEAPAQPLSCRAQGVTDVPPPFGPEGTRGMRVVGQLTSRTGPPAPRTTWPRTAHCLPGPLNLKKRIAPHGNPAKP